MLRETISHFKNSISYASTIQKGLLPKQRHFDSAFIDHFVVYRPKQVIGGDFYWLTRKGPVTYSALADCTGHGIGGAMLSVIGISLLNYVINKNYENIGDILTEIDKKWIETFNDADKDVEFNNDWMEITLCSFNSVTNEFQYCSANGEFILMKEGEPELMSGNKFPIRGWQIEKNRTFDKYNLDLNINDRLYFYSDGIKHQYNSSNTKKFSRRKLMQLLSVTPDLKLADQKDLFLHVFDDWKSDNEQTDDITFIGIQF